jgi:hypothetical protein
MCSTPPSFIVCVDPCPSTFVPNLNHETMSHVFVLVGPSTFTILPIVLNFEILVGSDVMCSGSNVGYGTNLESPIIEVILKFRFLVIDDKDLENVNKGGQRVSKHAELWANNAFDKWRIFLGFDTNKLIANLLEDEYSIKDLVDMLSSFVLQVAKQDDSCILQPSTFPLPFSVLC